MCQHLYKSVNNSNLLHSMHFGIVHRRSIYWRTFGSCSNSKIISDNKILIKKWIWPRARLPDHRTVSSSPHYSLLVQWTFIQTSHSPCDHYGGNNTQRSAGGAIDICNRSKELITFENFLIFLLPSRFIINDEWRKRESGLYSWCCNFVKTLTFCNLP